MTISKIDDSNASRLAEIMKTVGHPARLRIVSLLCLSDLRVSDMVKKLNLTQAHVSQQLRILRMSGLVSTVQSNGISQYTLAEPKLIDLINCVAGCKHK